MFSLPAVVKAGAGCLSLWRKRIIQYSSAELHKLACYSTPDSLAVIKSLELLRRPRYMHRGSRRKFIYSDSPIPSVLSVCSGPDRRHQNKLHVCRGNLRPLVCVDSVTPPIQPAYAINNAVTFMLLNAQSINNKPGLIHATITDRNINILCLTETWQKEQDFVSLNKATPPGYVYLQKPRSVRGGGGLAIIHREDIRIKEVSMPAVTSFEYVVFTLTGFSQIQFVLIYRPPKTKPTVFLSELSELLTPV